jgi:WD40 repeat protein
MGSGQRNPVGDPLRGHTSRVSSVAFGVGGSGRPLLATASEDRTVRLWDLNTGAPVATLHRRPPAQCVALAGDALAIGDDEGIALVEIDTGELANH